MYYNIHILTIFNVHISQIPLTGAHITVIPDVQVLHLYHWILGDQCIWGLVILLGHMPYDCIRFPLGMELAYDIFHCVGWGWIHMFVMCILVVFFHQ